MARDSRVTIIVHADKLMSLMQDLFHARGPHWRDNLGLEFEVVVELVAEDSVALSLPKRTVDGMIEREALDKWREKYK